MKNNPVSKTDKLHSRSEENLSTMFINQVKLTPKNIAIWENGNEISYEELENLALQIGKSIENHLRVTTYSGSQRFIGILLPQGYQYISSELAVFLTAKICVPLSIEYQLSKLDLMLKEFENPLVITTGDVLEQVGLDYKNTLLLDREFEDSSFSSCGLDSFAKNIEKDESLAFAYYTSGSTGKPKSVLISHLAYINFIQWSKEYFNIKGSDSSLLFLNPAFSLTIQEIWPILLSGGKLVVPPAQLRYNVIELRKWVKDQEITMITMVSSVAEKFFSVEKPEEEFSSKLRGMFCAGERMNNGPPMGSTFHLCYCYGNTETLGVSFTHIGPGMKSISSVGQPFPGVKVLIVDEDIHELNPSELGEICVTGEFLASGYYNRPDLNAEKFIEIHNEIYYRTGDIGLISDINGELIVKGRKELDQIKIRGYTVQLNEIQEVAERFDGIDKVVVTVNRTTEPQIVLFYKTKQKFENFDNAKFIEYLENHIPHYAYPSLITKVENIPLSANGKVDRNELLKLTLLEEITESKSSPVITETEKYIAKLWSEILGIPISNIMKTNNFFGIGGNSILASKFITKLKNEQYNVQIFHVFKTPVLMNFAKFLDEKCVKTSVANKKRAVRDHDEYFPLSFAQEQLWLQIQQSKENNSVNTMYNQLVSFSLPKEMDMNILKKVVEIVMNENDILRTTIHEIDGAPFQRINSISTMIINAIYSDRSVSSVLEFSTMEFDLEKGPLIRFVFRESENQLDVHYHHIIMDEIGVGNLQQELENTYVNIITHKIEDYNSIPKFQYRDFIEFEKNEQDNKEHKKSLDFWTKYLCDITPLDFPNDKDRINFENASNIVQMKFSTELSNAIKEYATAHNTTIFNTLLASTFSLLYRFTQQTTDMTIITANDGRELNETMGMIGHTVNMIPIRINYEKFGNLTFSEVLQLVQENLIQLLEHRTTPVQSIIQSLGVSSKDTGLFDIGIGLVKNQGTRDNINYFKRLPMEHHRRNTVHNLFFNYEQIENDIITINIEFNSTLYNFNRIENMSKNLETMLTHIFMDDESREISHIPILSDFDIQSLKEWNDTEGDFDPSWNLIDFFKEACNKYPQNIAIEDANGDQMSYLSLLRKSETLAHQFLQTSSPSSEFVATLLPQGSELLTTTLACFMSGKIIVPLSIDYTVPKLTTMLEQLNNPILITKDPIMRKIGIKYGNTTYILNDKEVERKLETNFIYHKIAFGYFTSGSTGVPKLVMVKHAAIVNLVEWFVEYYQVKSTDISSLFITPSFDASIVDIWPFLLSGSKLIVPPPEYRYSMTDLRQWTKPHKVTCMNFSVAVAEEFYNCEPNEVSPTLRWIFCGGDKLTRPPPRGMPFKVNLFYGITEATCCTTFKILDPIGDKRLFGSIYPSGKPLRNVEIIILDDNLEPVPIGVYGEVCISGISLAEGYFNNEELNRERFISHPKDPKKRLYRSGDLGAWLYEGEILLKGRKDLDQIKIRGFRVELGEIVRLISNYSPNIQKVVVLPERNPEDLKVHQIHAFCKVNERQYGNKQDFISDIRNYLLHHLPHYTVPNTITILAEFPLTTNGKIDKQTLINLKNKNASGNEVSEITPPKTKLEFALASIWANVLNIPEEELCTTDNFFEMGGNSLLIGKIISLIKHDPVFEKYDLRRLTTANFFGSPTIESLARIIEDETENVEETVMQENYKVELNLDLGAENDSTSILLTGATGYLGGCLLATLLSKTSNTTKVFCLVRGNSNENARIRLNECLQKFNHKMDESWIDRIKVLCGDLSKEHFGLDSTIYELLCNTIGKIYHSAAEVNFLKSYEQLKDSNVHGTHSIIKFAGERKIKEVHYISTIGVFGYKYLFGDEILNENTLAKFHDTEIGYSKSKWVAEILVKQSFSVGIPGNIYRPGTIGCHSAQDTKNLDDFLGLMFRCCKEVGYYPDIHWKFPYSTVDTTCEMVVDLSLKLSSGNIFHTFDKQLCFSQFFKYFNDVGLTCLSLSDWKTLILKQESDTCSEYILGMQSLIGTKFYENLTFFELPHNKSAIISNTITKSKLKMNTVNEEELIKRYFDVVYKSL